MSYSFMYGLKPADRIVENIFPTGFSKHHTIYLGIDGEGTEWVSANIASKGGVVKMKASDYFKTRKRITIQQFTGSYEERIEAVKRALSRLGEPYDLIKFNCEHYAEYVQTGNAVSKQVENVATLFAAAIGVALIIGIINIISND